MPQLFDTEKIYPRTTTGIHNTKKLTLLRLNRS